MLDFVWTPRRVVKLQEQVLLLQKQYDAKVAAVDHLLAQRDALAKELEIRNETCGNAMREVERLTNELHTYEMVSTPPLKPPTRKRQQKTQENK